MLNVIVDLFFWFYTFIQVENLQIMDKIIEMHFLLELFRLAPCATLHLVDVELEPLDRVRGGPGDLLDAARADGAQGEHGARGLRRPRRGQLAVGMSHSLG